jgi:hypothetical protein
MMHLSLLSPLVHSGAKQIDLEGSALHLRFAGTLAREEARGEERGESEEERSAPLTQEKHIFAPKNNHADFKKQFWKYFLKEALIHLKSIRQF